MSGRTRKEVRDWRKRERICKRGHVVIEGLSGYINSNGALACRDCASISKQKRKHK